MNDMWWEIPLIVGDLTILEVAIDVSDCDGGSQPEHFMCIADQITAIKQERVPS